MSALVLLDIVLLALLVITAIAAVEVRNLYSAVMLAGIYSLLMACFWMTNDALDVAYTEAAVGAGISTILLIGTLVLTGSVEAVRRAISWPALVACICAGSFLIYGTLDMPAYGDPSAPAHTNPMYEGLTRQNAPKDPAGQSAADAAAWRAANPDADDNFFQGHVPNQVTSVIVGYRALDTMFEAAVILTAGLSLIILLRGRKGNPQRGGLL